jgi:hypothetical protein
MASPPPHDRAPPRFPPPIHTRSTRKPAIRRCMDTPPAVNQTPSPKRKPSNQRSRGAQLTKSTAAQPAGISEKATRRTGAGRRKRRSARDRADLERDRARGAGRRWTTIRWRWRWRWLGLVVWKEERNYGLNNTVRELHDDDGLETGGPEPGLIGSRLESVRVQRSFGASSGPAACTGFSVRGWGASAVGSWLSARVDGDPEDAWWWGGDVCVCCG